jgi:hypothetical protein
MKKSFATFVTDILDAKKEGEAAKLRVFGLCLEFDQSQSWVGQFKTFDQLLREVLHVSVATYNKYNSAVKRYGRKRADALGLAGACALAGALDASDPKLAKKASTAIYENVKAHLLSFQAEAGTTPSDRHVANIVREEALALGVAVPKQKRGVVSDKLQRAIDVLSIIAELDPGKHRTAVDIACGGLMGLGVNVERTQEAVAA